MENLLWWQYALIGAIFIWSGFVRSGLGFGGAVLALPFLLLVKNDPLLFLPIISIHLLVFSSWIAWQGSRVTKQQAKLAAERGEAPQEAQGNIAWGYLKKALGIMIVPKLIGVFGLLTLPGNIVTGVIFVIVAVFAVSYILNKPFYTNNKFLDTIFLMLGGYVSGTSLIGQPHSKSRNTRLLPIRRLGVTHRLRIWFVLDVHALRLSAGLCHTRLTQSRQNQYKTITCRSAFRPSEADDTKSIPIKM